MALTPEEEARLKQSFSLRSEFGGKHYTGNKQKKLSKKEKRELAESGEKRNKTSPAQRKTGHLTVAERKEL
ncbi:hypothetical protein, partial [Clostridioides difficile]